MTDDELDQALCAQTDPFAFHPEKGGSTADARRTCLGCDVRSACLKDVLTAPQEEWGVWAATTPEQRKPLRRRIVDAEGDPVLIDEVIDEGMRLGESRVFVPRAEQQRIRRANAIANLNLRLRDAA